MKNKILASLEKSNDFVSGEELSKSLGVSRTAVWKNIKALREEGYIIESVTNRGYRLTGKPSLLDAERIRASLDTNLVGTDIVVLRTVDSTNEEVKRRARQGSKSCLIVAAEEQTMGKGRVGRDWSSSAGGLYFTIMLRPELPPENISSITLAAGYGVCLAVREYTGLDAKIKWPNDIIIGNKKLCGILTEMAAQADMIDYVAVGIGINVNIEAFPENIREKATSLYLETGRKLDRNDFFISVLRHLDIAAAAFLAGFTDAENQEFRSLCATIGRRVQTTKGNITIEGEAVDVCENGELLVRDDTGELHKVNSGEVLVQGIY